jgi:hypothetical protein
MSTKIVNTVNRVDTFGDVRRLILETVINIRDENITVSQGMAIAANIKVLNDNIQAEINAAKLSIATEGRAHQFGNVVSMGRRLISDNDAPGE